MNKKYKSLGGNIILFSINGFVPKIFILLMIPICTKYLTAFEYGVADLILNTVQLLIPIFTLDIQDAVMRYAMDKQKKKEDVLSLAIKVISKGSIILFIFLAFISLSDRMDIKKEYFFFIGVLFVVNALYNSFSLFCKGIDKVNLIVHAGLINSFTILLGGILLLIPLKLGVKGYLTALLLGKSLAVFYLFIKGKLYKFINSTIYAKQTQKEMMKYSIPLVMSVIAWWINSAADRYIITYMSGAAASGIYAISYTIPNILMIFQNIFSQAWSISAIKEFNQNDTDGFVSNIYELMNGGMVILCSAIMLINMLLARILFVGDFFYAYKYVPPLLVSVVFNTMGLFIGSIFTAIKDSKTLAVSTVIGAMVNIIANFILIYLFGVYGAAIATLLGYIVVFILRQSVVKKHIRLNINLKRSGCVYFLLILQMYITFKYSYQIGIQCIFLILIIVPYKNEVLQLKKKILSIIK